MRVDPAGFSGQQPHHGVGHFQAVACRPNGRLGAVRAGLSREASRPNGVSTRLGTTRLARTSRAMPSRATCRQIPSRAAFDASYAGIPVAARRLAAELMNTIAEPGSSTASAAAVTRKCARVLTANVWSHWAAVVPAIPRPSPMPAFSTKLSRPPSAAADAATTAAHASGAATLRASNSEAGSSRGS